MLGSGRISAEAAASVTAYLEKVYWSMGETLPHEHLTSNLQSIHSIDNIPNSLIRFEKIRLEIHETKTMNTEEVRQHLLDALMNSALESDLSRGILWNGPRSLPRRWLPHGPYFDLYTLYCASQLASDEPVASKSTFYRVLNSSGWKKKIKFSPPSAHSKCSTCSRLKGQIQNAKGIQAHSEACDRLLRHLAGQFNDRACYWECRNRSKQPKTCSAS